VCACSRRPGQGSTEEDTHAPPTQPVAPDVKALYLDNCLRRIVRALADGGEDNLAALRRTWPQLAGELEVLAVTLALPVRASEQKASITP
jgi:hypothetical protein